MPKALFEASLGHRVGFEDLTSKIDVIDEITKSMSSIFLNDVICSTLFFTFIFLSQFFSRFGKKQHFVRGYRYILVN